MMTISDYKKLISQNGFQEYPLYNDGTSLVSNIINYGETDLELKIYINKLILCRSFYGTYTAWQADVKWFIERFFKELQKDIIKPYLTDTIKYAANMITANNPFTQGIISTTFMFPIIEFYAKYKLGFRPMECNFFDYKEKKKYLENLDVPDKKRDLSIKLAFEQLKKKEFLISDCINDIDEFTSSKLSAAEIPSNDWTVHSIAERLHLVRNPMLHGEIQSFYAIGEYLLLLYSLFHLCDLMELSA